MPVIRPFKAVRYNTAKVKDISSVVAPPYDVISQKLQDELYRKDEHNFVKIELNRIKPSDNENDNRYTRSRDLFESWVKNRVLINDDKDAVYIYALKYKRGTKAVEQVGFIGLMGLELEGGSKVLPHENTLAAPKEDRLKLTRALGANLSPIFVLYEDRAHRLTRILKKFMSGNKPLIDMESDGVRHRLWKLEEKNNIKKIVDLMAHKDIFIADGHHRYEVSRMYCKEAQGAANYMMIYFVEMDERMLTVLPAHRIIKNIGNLKEGEILKRLERFFYVEKAAALDALITRMSQASGRHAFGMYLGKDDYRLLRLKSVKDSDKAIKDKPAAWKRLDVSILHYFIIQRVLGVRDGDDNIEFLKSAQDSAKAVDSGRFKLAFFLNPTKVSEVRRIARIGERMPRKATYFYPKPLSGLVINKF